MKIKLLIFKCDSLFLGMFIAIGVLVWGGNVRAGLVIDHNAVAKFDQYKDNSDFQNAVETAKQNFHLGYGHTSHGSQITSGMTGLNIFMNNLGYSQNLFAWNNGGSDGALDLEEGASYGEGWLDHDCGYTGWDDETRYYLDGSDPGAGTADHSDVNAIMWSWCGQVNDVDIQTHYLDNMADLENEYPGVTFIYMTGHLEGMKTGDAWFGNNNAIRDWVSGSEDRVLFDFADIEKYDPDQDVNFADYFADDNCDYDSDGTAPRSEDSNWAVNWQNSHTQNVDWYSVSCAHSQSLNCNQKAKAFWYMMARMAGWNEDEISSSPSVDNVSGDFIHGNSVLVSGSGFGSNGPNLLIFDDFEGGIEGNKLELNLATLGSWDFIQTEDHTSYSSLDKVSGNLAARFDSYGYPLNQHPNIYVDAPVAFNSFYISWWELIPEGDRFPGCDGYGGCNWKTIWVTSNTGSVSEGDVTISTHGAGSAWSIFGNSYPYEYTPYLKDPWNSSVDLMIPNGQWHRFQFYIKGRVDFNGEERIWLTTDSGGTRLVKNRDRQTIDIEDLDVRQRFHVNGYVRDTPDSHPTFDDIYIAYGENAQARVEIGDAVNYVDCGSLTMCTPTLWSDGLIECTVRGGNLQDGQVWIYLTDANGIRSEGYPITIGSEEETCSDGIQNQDETGIDCGGVCPPCPTQTTYNLTHFIQLISDWLKSEPDLVSDVNNDGVVNTRDLGIMMSNWQN